jgi:general secretion pathway protein G
MINNDRMNKGFTLVELMLVVTIVGILTGIAIPTYSGYREKVDAAQASADIIAIGLALEKYYSNNNKYPDSLDEIGTGSIKDPWGRPYQYLNMANDPKNNQCRKIGPIHPLNTDYDLYSKGEDGESNKPINSKKSQDDIIRAYNGTYIGLAKNLI